MDCDPHEHVVNTRLGIFDLDIKVSVVIENTGIDQFELHRCRTTTTCVLLDQPLIRRIGRIRERAGEEDAPVTCGRSPESYGVTPTPAPACARPPAAPHSVFRSDLRYARAPAST